MANPYRFYTYAYLRKDRTPYYIGKGQRDRAYCKYKDEIKPPIDKSRIIFLKQNLTEEDAFKHEIYMIAVFGRKDLGTGILRNKTNGGEGPSGWVPSEETRKNWSEMRKGENAYWYGRNHSQETIEKMKKERSGVKNAMYGKTHNEKTKNKMSKSHIGRPATNGFKGKKHTEESKQKLRENNGNKLGGAKSAKIMNSQKWMCLETGFISTLGPLTRYQNKRGIDTSKRKRIS